MDVSMGLVGGAGIAAVGGIFWAGRDEGSGCKISERVKKERWRDGEGTD